MKNLLYLLLLLSVASCATGKFKAWPIKDAKTATGYEMKQYGKVYIGGQPSTVDFIKLRQEGFVAVVNLRVHKEDKNKRYNEKWERNNSLLSGMSYYHVDFDPKEDKVSNAFVNKLKVPVNIESAKGKVLIHCATGNRAAMWVAANAYLNKNATSEQARAVGVSLGLKKKPLERLNEFLSK